MLTASNSTIHSTSNSKILVTLSVMLDQPFFGLRRVKYIHACNLLFSLEFMGVTICHIGIFVAFK